MKLLKFTKEFFSKEENQFIILLFIAWRIWILLFALVGMFLPLASKDFLGGTIGNYLRNPLFWSWSNFDGEHYIAIAQRGYQNLEHSFFPLYPIIVNLFSFGNHQYIPFVGILIANISFFLSLFFLWMLIRMDYSKKIAFLSLLSLILFPTSFYFGALYTESLFLFLTVVSFFAARKSKWMISGIFGALASSTRIYGVILIPALLFEWMDKKGSKSLKNSVIPLLSISFILTGFVGYLYYSYKTTGNPFVFYTDLSPFGEQRSSSSITPLPQVFWRYIKMIFTVDILTPTFVTIFFEFVVGLTGLLLIIYGFVKRIRSSYLTFALLSYILPTLTGSFSSLPRYILVIFPLFILSGLSLSKVPKVIRLLVCILMLVLLALQTMFFVRGYWVA